VGGESRETGTECFPACDGYGGGSRSSRACSRASWSLILDFQYVHSPALIIGGKAYLGGLASGAWGSAGEEDGAGPSAGCSNSIDTFSNRVSMSTKSRCNRYSASVNAAAIYPTFLLFACPLTSKFS
jgi:hypothetical protein